MANAPGLERFITAQEGTYSTALAEIKAGRKRTHWMWYIFPQVAGLGRSEMAKHFAIRDIQEAANYLIHPILGKRLIDITEALLDLPDKNAHKIFGDPDDLKLKSSMTLFSLVPNPPKIFQQIIDQYFEGQQDLLTIELVNRQLS